LNVHPHFAFLDSYEEARNRESVRVLGLEAGAHVELPAVFGTYDEGAGEGAFAQRVAGVGTTILHGVDLVADSEQPDLDLTDADAQTPPVRNLAKLGDAV